MLRYLSTSRFRFSMADGGKGEGIGRHVKELKAQFMWGKFTAHFT